MTSPEDFSDMGSNFLDSMLEVQMTEEDGEVTVAQSDELSPNNARELPPIPRFDLHSETLNYKSDYSAVLRSQPSCSSRSSESASLVASTVQVPLTPTAPMLVIRSDLMKSNSTKTSTASNSVQSAASGKPSPVLKSLLTKAAFTSESVNELHRQVFNPLYTKVFSKQDPPHDVTEYAEEENEFYQSVFQDVSKVQMCKLHCTICDKHIGCSKDIEKDITVHSMLKVMTCNVCREFYGDGNFPCDDGDHYEIYCRWCGQGGALVCCSFCPKVFCKRCLRRNFGRALLRAIERSTDWACFCCAQKPLWPHRAVCRALLEYVQLKKADSKTSSKDTSICCKSPAISRKSLSEADKSKIVLSGGQPVRASPSGKESLVLTGSDTKPKANAPVTKAMSGNGHLVIKNLPSGYKVVDKNKSPATHQVGKSQTVVIPVKATGGSSLAKSTVPRNVSSVPPLTAISTTTIPRVISTPIYHGQTLITPPPKGNAVQRKSAPSASNANRVEAQSTPRVSVTDWANVDVSRLPVARIPRNVQGVILRLNFPDNRVQLVRLVADDNGCDKSFPMPTFENSDNLDFLEGSLEDSFKLTKMLYERLLKIKEKVNTKTQQTKQGIYSSSVKKLSFIYEKTRELMKELDENLLSNYENWKNDIEVDNVSIIEVSDEEKSPILTSTPVLPSTSALPSTSVLSSTSALASTSSLPSTSKSPATSERSSIFAKKTKMFAQDDDSDIEVLVAASNNLLASQRTLRSGSLTKGGELVLPKGLPPLTKIEDLQSGKALRLQRQSAPPAPETSSRRQVSLTPSTIALDKLPHNIASKRRKIMRRQTKRIKLAQPDESGGAEVPAEKDPLAVSDAEEVEETVPRVDDAIPGPSREYRARDSSSYPGVYDVKPETIDKQ